MAQPDKHNSTWKDFYESAILEPDDTKLIRRIADARVAIFDRAEEILSQPSGDEQRALNNALRMLQLLEELALQQNSASPGSVGRFQPQAALPAPGTRQAA